METDIESQAAHQQTKSPRKQPGIKMKINYCTTKGTSYFLIDFQQKEEAQNGEVASKEIPSLDSGDLSKRFGTLHRILGRKYVQGV